VRVADLVLAVSLAACGGGGGPSTIDTGTPLASGPPAPSVAPSPSPSATPAAPAPSVGPAPSPAPPAAAPAPLFTAQLLDSLGQAGFQGLNNLGQAAWTMVDPDAPRGLLAEPPQFGRFFDGTQVQQVIGNRPAHVLGVNDAGQVVGQLIESSDTRVFRWSPDAPDALVVIDFQPGTYTVAHGMNRKGQVTGTITTRNVPSAYRWTPPSPVTTVEGLEPLTGAGTFPPVIDGQFINDDGTVAGISSTPSGSVHAALWVPGQQVLDLGSLGTGDVSVEGLNNANQVVGQADLGPGVHHAYRWSAAEGMVDLGTLGGPNSSASAINAGGTVVGTSDTADPGSTRAFVWTGGAMTSLGTLGGGWSAATRINASGQVGGTSANANGMAHAFLWTAATGMVDLNARIPTETTRVLQSVVALADDGSMLVSSTDGLLLLRPQKGS
jgi:probable HAF family extracellular repeat protein